MRSKTPRKPINILAAISGIPHPVKMPSNQSAATLRGSFQKLISSPWLPHLYLSRGRKAGGESEVITQRKG
jgi:hypothetical protein